MTSLPSHFEQILADGLRALRMAEADLRASAAASYEPGPILLEVRNVGGLADRLGDTAPSEWRSGSIPWFNSQDVAVVRELADSFTAELSHNAGESYRDRLDAVGHLRALATFLDWYLDHYMELLFPEQ